MACLWTRDTTPWRSALNLTAEQVQQTHAQWNTDGFTVQDLAGYLDGTFRYTLIGAQDPTVQAAEVYVGLNDQETADAWERLRKRGLMFHSLHVAADENDAVRSCWVTQKRSGGAYRFYRSLISDELFHIVGNSSGLPLVDVSIQEPIIPAAPTVRYQKVVAECDERLRTMPGEAAALRTRADAHFLLGNNEQALADYTAILALTPDHRDTLARRSAVLSRLNRGDEARQDAERLRATRGPAKEFWDYYGEAFFTPGLGEYETLDKAVSNLPVKGVPNPANSIEYNLACLYSVAARELAHTNPEAAQLATRNAIKHLNIADSILSLEANSLLHDSDLTALHDQEEFQSLVQKKIGQWWFVALWAGIPGRQSRGLDGDEPAMHLEKMKQLVADNFRPVSLSVAAKDPGTRLGTASVWHRPSITAEEFSALAARRAYAAITALELGEEDICWDRLRQGSAQTDPTERSLLIHSFAALNVKPQKLIQRLQHENNDSVRQALILSLGEYPISSLPEGELHAIKANLLKLYNIDPDPGVHAATRWLLRQWNYQNELLAADQQLVATATPSGDRRWSVNSQGQTFVSLPGEISFYMGSPEDEEHKSFDEVGHQRSISRSYMICTTPVTIAQYGEFLKAHPELQRAEHNQLLEQSEQPATMISWFEAAQYCRWLSEAEGLPEDQMCFPPIADIKPGMLPISGFLQRTGYRLPTEAEWEYACRAGSSTPYSFGYATRLIDEYGWYFQNSERRLRPVGLLKPNSFGLFDVHGNAMQWCFDQYTSEYIDRQSGRVDEINEALPILHEPRVHRGGTVVQEPSKLRSASRDSQQPSSRHERVGFRIVRTLPNALNATVTE